MTKPAKDIAADLDRHAAHLREIARILRGTAAPKKKAPAKRPKGRPRLSQPPADPGLEKM